MAVKECAGCARRERVVRQFGEGVETLGVPAQQLRNQPSGEVGTGDAVAAVALHVVDIVIEAPNCGIRERVSRKLPVQR
jgi:hypothetical protein